jgi:hypothetical protein
MPEEAPPVVALVVVAQAEYENWDPVTHKGWEPLTKVQQAASELVAALVGRGYELELPKLLQGGTRTEVEQALDKWFQERSPADRVLLYWTGHGAMNAGHYLVTRDSQNQGSLTKLNTIATGSLGDVIAKSKAEKVLVVLDTCYSSGAAPDFAANMLEVRTARTGLPGQVHYLALQPSAHALAKAQEAVLCRALVEVLTGQDPDGRKRSWTDQDRLIGVGELLAALLDAAKEKMGADWVCPDPLVLGWRDKFLPNPRFTGARPAVDVETRRSLPVPSALDRAARGIEGAESGWYFTGRTRVLTELAMWLRDGIGLVVLTGPPGAGKSAVLGRMVILSDPEVVAEAKNAGALHGVPKEAMPPKAGSLPRYILGG